MPRGTRGQAELQGLRERHGGDRGTRDRPPAEQEVPAHIESRRHGLLALLQLTDSGLPVGSFAHSDGIEALVASGRLRDADELEHLLSAHCRLTLRAGDSWFVRAGHRAAKGSDDRALREVAEGDRASRVSAVFRTASLTVGGNLLRAAMVIADPAEANELRRVEAALGDRTPRATVFGVVAAAFRAGEDEAVEGYVYTAVAGMVSAAVRLRVVAPLDGQAILRRVLADREAPPVPERAFFSPLLDVASMSHELLEARLFSS